MPRKKKEKAFKRVLRKGLRLFLILVLAFVVLTVSQVVLLKFIDPPFTAGTAWPWLKNGLGLRHDQYPLYEWRGLKKISSHLRKSVLAGEDQRFLSHHGFDFIEMDKALGDILMQKRVRGASTISMQTARTVFLWSGRNWVRKIAEAYYTLLIEVFWSKERILETYLNTVDWGTGIMGAERASRIYFNVSSSRITESQAALLAAVLPNPHKWSPAHPNDEVEERKRRIMRDMAKMPLI